MLLTVQQLYPTCVQNSEKIFPHEPSGRKCNNSVIKDLFTFTVKGNRASHC